MCSNQVNEISEEQQRPTGDEISTNYLDEASVLILGASESGKSTIVSRLVYDEFVVDKRSTPTDEIDFLDICDVSGMVHFRIKFHNLSFTDSQAPWSSAVKHDIITAKAFLLVYAVNNRESFDKALEYRERINTLRGDSDFPVLLVGNKIDLKERVITTAEAELRALHWDTDVLEISAKGPYNMGELKRYIYRMVDVPPRLYETRRRSSLQQVLASCFTCELEG